MKLRHALIATACAGASFIQPSESQAIFHWCNKCATPAPAPAPAYMAPPAVSYYAPCAPPTVVNYVPQTYYRPVVVNTPVTSYQPVTSCGMCGPTTTMRPVTTMVQQTQYVPYTSYRLMYSAAMPVVTTNYLAPAVVAPAPPMMAPAAPACCGQGAPAMPAPSAMPISPAMPSPGAPAPDAASGLTPTPSLNGPVPGTSAYGSGAPTYANPGTSNYPSPSAPNYSPSAPSYSPSAPSSSNYGPSLNGGTQNYNPPSNSTTTPSTPGPTSTAPSYDPLHPTAPPDIHLKPTPEESSPQAGPTSTPPRQADADARTAARGMTVTRVLPSGVIPANYTQPTAPMPNVDWRPSSR